MEKVVTITKVQPLKERSYINGNGDNEIFVSRGFVMTDGIDTFYAEATGEYARQLPAEIDTTVCHSEFEAHRSIGTACNLGNTEIAHSAIP